jgi:hypothetical protein
MQTAVEWLIEQLKNNEFLGTFCTPDCFEEKQVEMKSIIDQAKEKEKQQIIKFIENVLENYTHFKNNELAVSAMCNENGCKSINELYNEYFHATNQ